MPRCQRSLRLLAAALAAASAGAEPAHPAYLANLSPGPVAVCPWLDGTCRGDLPVLFRTLERIPEPGQPRPAGAPLTGPVALQPGEILELTLEREAGTTQVRLFQIRLLGMGRGRGWCFRYTAPARFPGLPAAGHLGPAEASGAGREAFRRPGLEFDRLEFLGQAQPAP